MHRVDDSPLVAYGTGQGSVIIRSLGTGEVLRTFSFPEARGIDVVALGWHDQELVLAGNADAGIAIWNVTTGMRICAIPGIRVSPNIVAAEVAGGVVFAEGTKDGIVLTPLSEEIDLLDPSTYMMALEKQDSIYGVVASSASGKLRCFDLGIQRRRDSNLDWDFFGGMHRSPLSLAAMPDGSVIHAYHSYDDKQVVIREKVDGPIPMPGRVDILQSCDIAVTEQSILVAAGVGDNTHGYTGYDKIRIWRLNECFLEIEVDQPVVAVRIANDGCIVVALGDGLFCLELISSNSPT